MAKAIVKCPYCEKQFDRNSTPFVKIGRRYAHVECYEKLDERVKEEQQNEVDFWEYIKQLYGKDYDYVLIKKQAEAYIKDYNFTYGGMLKSLKWFYEVKHGSSDNSHGRIGIIPYIYKDARDYYYNLYKAQQVNKDAEQYHIQEKEITIKSPYLKQPKLKLFNLEDD